MKNAKRYLVLLLFWGAVGCVDFSETQQAKTDDSPYRIPLGNCADYQDVVETFTNIYTNLISQPAGASSKGCAGASSCHSTATNLGGWNIGSNQAQAYINLTTLTGLSGKRLITPNSIDDSNIIIRLSLVNNVEPRNGTLWFNTDLIAIKRWVCQGALNN